jgi:hypothetical protein
MIHNWTGGALHLDSGCRRIVLRMVVPNNEGWLPWSERSRALEWLTATAVVEGLLVDLLGNAPHRSPSPTKDTDSDNPATTPKRSPPNSITYDATSCGRPPPERRSPGGEIGLVVAFDVPEAVQ